MDTTKKQKIMYKLIRVCGCCGEPELIEESLNKEELQEKLKIKKGAAEIYWETHGHVFKEPLGIEDHVDLYRAMTHLMIKSEEFPETKEYFTFIESLFNDYLKKTNAPKELGMTLHII